MSKIKDWVMNSLGLNDPLDNPEEEQPTVSVQERMAEEETAKPKRFSFSRPEKSEKTERREDKKEIASTRATGGYSWSGVGGSYSSDSRRTASGRVVNMHSASTGTYSSVNMVIKQPTDYNGAKEIARYLKDGQPVVVNLEKLEKATAQKVTDFLSGAICALDGKIQKVANGILVVTPNNIGITGHIHEDFTASAFAELDI